MKKNIFRDKKGKIIILVAAIAVAVAAIILILFHRPDNYSQNIIEKILQPEEEFIPNQNIDIQNVEANLAKDSLYQDFRKNFRMHYQTIGLASFADSSRLILLSEPAPYFNVDTLQQICSKFTHTVEIKTHKIGYDGYIRDILLIIGNATTENVNHLTQELSKALYLSDYKCNTTQLPIQKPRAYFVKENLDYEITLDEFNAWFIEDGEQFVQLKDTTKSYVVKDFFNQKKRGIYFSKMPGFVAWCLAKNQDIETQKSEIRQFALDADLLLGAFADSSTLVIIAREREAQLEELPPLNIETVLLLASVTEKELSQSLDVNDFLAGKMNNGHDWCPTYLSKELENTEFGHLLTITDILLKNWSENGTIQEAHYRYPAPPRYPFDKPLFDKLGLSELVYNWNTWNAMYAIDLDGFTIYSLHSTGSLPVSYFNSPERNVSIGRQYENQAYRYFSRLGNTDLARVVQYTALYQLFMDNGITYSGNTYAAYPKQKPYLLYGPVKSFLQFFRDLQDTQITYFADTLAHKNFTAYQKKQVDKQLARNEQNHNFTYSDEQREDIYQKVIKDHHDYLKGEFWGVKNMLENLTEDEFNELAKYLSYPRGMSRSKTISRQLYQRSQKVNMLMRQIGKNNLSLFNTDLREVRNFYVSNLANSSAKYLKTPSIIVTYNDMVTTGGHNLSSGITRVKSLSNYERGTGTPRSTPPSTTPQPSKPSPTTPQSKPAAPYKSSAPKTTTTSASKPSSGTTHSSSPVRPRSTVISNSARPNRGF